MSNLTSTVPGAFEAFYSLLKTAGAAQSPVIPVISGELEEYEPQAYVLLAETPSGKKPVENHRMDPAALGSFAMYEEYEFWGYVSCFQGDVDPAAVLSSTWTAFQNVVMTPVVQNRGANGTQVLGSSAPAALEYIVPITADFTFVPGTIGGGMGGFMGVIEFGFQVKARITVP